MSVAVMRMVASATVARQAIVSVLCKTK
jgi:hypothetical protein